MRYILVVAAALALTACGTVASKMNDVLDSARGEAAKQTAASLDEYCTLRGGNIVARKAFVDAVNAAAKAKLTAFDCDGDGKPDF